MSGFYISWGAGYLVASSFGHHSILVFFGGATCLDQVFGTQTLIHISLTDKAFQRGCNGKLDVDEQNLTGLGDYGTN